MSIGEKIKKLRKLKGLTQEELANKCGLSKNGLWNYENNKRKPNTEILERIATALEVNFLELIMGKTTLTNMLFLFCSVNFDQEYINNVVGIDFSLFQTCFENDEDLPEDDLIKLINTIYQDDPSEFLRFFHNNFDFIKKHNNVLKFCRKKKRSAESKIFESFNKSMNSDDPITYGEAISKIPTYTLDFKKMFYEYIQFNYESNFDDISVEDKLTNSELHYLYKKSVEYIDLLTEKMKSEKKIAKLNNSLNNKEGE
ncbi:helix-turn-helix transcriptional regulator [Clostridium botulinum]|uniref:Helix-turn-helix transcriptional regulator n=1 Tax=Clostridium botulinum TaxID=1491 RepID=A0A846JVB3_CLOBO|nr:helix-turn-helix transcriptional regulator [Clostridium botulinum]NFN35285.1 helix-turn-helix transcriptional regulator [Clostridium botulinum]